jgi:hypothetical protein
MGAFTSVCNNNSGCKLVAQRKIVDENTGFKEDRENIPVGNLCSRLFTLHKKYFFLWFLKSIYLCTTCFGTLLKKLWKKRATQC